MQLHAPVVPTQAIYRQMLQALSHPGRLYSLDLREWDSPLLAVCQTLFDHEVSYCVLPGGNNEWENEIFAATKARRAPLSEADYLIVGGHESRGKVSQAKVGEPTFPDQGATVFYVMDAPLANNSALRLSGPGIEREACPAVNPLTEAEWRLLRDLNAEFPLGADAFCLIGENQIMGLPRSTKIRIG
jgi:alpha-D-ribose 1-methylphosphonate 5-triphosphate synthase subunit PhnH